MRASSKAGKPMRTGGSVGAVEALRAKPALVRLVAGLVFGFIVFLSGCGAVEDAAQNAAEDAARDAARDVERRVEDQLTGGRTTPAAPAGDPVSEAPAGNSIPATAVREARTLLDGLPVAPAGSEAMEGYSREEFPHWAADAAEYGWSGATLDPSCDVRDAALIRDGEGVRIDGECRIYAGEWSGPYTGSTYTEPADLDIDHIVPLANAWRSGASGWTVADRETYANAPGVVLSADDSVNQQKGDKGPEEWRPPDRGYWCEYAARWTEIKAVWGLTVTADEKAALDEMLAGCDSSP